MNMRTAPLAGIVWAAYLSLNAGSLEASESLPVPERGFVSSQPARTWEEGLICGNGTIGANALSRPLDERIIFSHERLFLPMGAPLMPLDQSARLFEVRRLIERGLYKQACQLQFDLSGQDGFMYPDYFVPAFDLTIHTDAQGEVRDYARSVDFQTGETTVRWADNRGVFERRMFVSRAVGAAVVLLAARQIGPRLPARARAAGTERRVQCRFRYQQTLRRGLSGTRCRHREHGRRLRADLPQPIHQGLSRQHPRARELRSGGGDRGEDRAAGRRHARRHRADRILILVNIRLLHDPASSLLEEIERTLAELPSDYGRLLDGHAGLHGELFNRMRLDIGGGADHERSTEELLEVSTFEAPNRALIEKARRPLEEQPTRLHVVRAGATRPGGHQPGRRGARLPLSQASGEPILAQQPRLDAQPPLAVQHGHQRRHAGRDHQDAGSLRTRQNPTPAGAARSLAIGPDRGRAVPRRDRDPEPHSGTGSRSTSF